MQKFIYFLSDSPTYPNEIMARDKNEVMKLVCESVDKESIAGIYTEDEFLAKQGMKPSHPQQQSQDTPVVDDGEIEAPDYASGNDFMADMMNKALKKAKANEQRQQAMPPQPSPQPQFHPQPVQQDVKYFEDNGIKFKIEGGKVYKKVWTDISSGDGAEYRIIRKSTGKIVSGEGFVLEKLDWQELA